MINTYRKVKGFLSLSPTPPSICYHQMFCCMLTCSRYPWNQQLFSTQFSRVCYRLLTILLLYLYHFFWGEKINLRSRHHQLPFHCEGERWVFALFVWPLHGSWGWCMCYRSPKDTLVMPAASRSGWAGKTHWTPSLSLPWPCRSCCHLFCHWFTQ